MSGLSHTSRSCCHCMCSPHHMYTQHLLSMCSSSHTSYILWCTSCNDDNQNCHYRRPCSSHFRMCYTEYQVSLIRIALPYTVLVHIFCSMYQFLSTLCCHRTSVIGREEGHVTRAGGQWAGQASYLKQCTSRESVRKRREMCVSQAPLKLWRWGDNISALNLYQTLYESSMN